MNATTHYNGEETNSIKLKRKQLTFNNRSLEPSSFLLLFTLFSNRTDAPSDTAKQILPEREKQKRKKKKERKRRRRKKKRRLLFPLNTGLAKSPSPFSAVQLMDWAEVTREPHGTSSRNLKPLTCFPWAEWAKFRSLLTELRPFYTSRTVSLHQHSSNKHRPRAEPNLFFFNLDS